jgi:hypothetical protein
MAFQTRTLAQWWTLIISILFVFAVGASLALDTVKNGVTLETGHKLTHVIVGLIGLWVFRDPGKARLFCLFNAAFYGLVALTGYISALTYSAFAGAGFPGPAFLNIDAFNSVDTILHSLVVASGLAAGFWKR